ncbi:MAG TPA: hypothetical protein PK563_09280, partial [Tenuifilaceae bacterium]|nr:hypothetical protein [Tenuifilaceae bacterium]
MAVGSSQFPVPSWQLAVGSWQFSVLSWQRAESEEQIPNFTSLLFHQFTISLKNEVRSRKFGVESLPTANCQLSLLTTDYRLQ